MARTEKILALDIGASSIKVGEFDCSSRGGSVLTGFAMREYGEELNEGNRSVIIASLLRQILEEEHFTAREALLSISGQSALTRFVKLPPMAGEEKRIRQIVEFEARQNVPFPIDQVIWDYQLIGNPAGDDLEVMFVVVKNEIVEQVTNAIQAVGLDLKLVDVAPAACYNASRANHVGDESCSVVLNIGGRSTNLLFADKERVFARTIPIAGHSITQQIAKEFGIGLGEAEELKRRHGFVALGGAYEEPESEVAAAISKIVRNVMSRLHGEINRSISVYRSQQDGSRPTTMYLTGGSSIMAFTDRFFAEKLRMDVSYLNPFQVISLGDNIDRADLQEKAHMFSEVVGLALRYNRACPVEVSLVPPAILREQAFRKKKPYVFACLLCLPLVLFVVLLAQRRRAELYAGRSDVVVSTIDKLDKLSKAINREISAEQQVRVDRDSLTALLKKREVWPNLLNVLTTLKPDNIWFDSVTLLRGNLKADAAAASVASEPMGGGGMFGFMGGGGGGGQKAVVDQGPVTGLKIEGHGVSVRQLAEKSAPASGDAAGDTPAEKGGTEVEKTDSSSTSPELLLVERLQKVELFDESPQFTRILQYTISDDIRNYSSFVVQVKLKNPIPVK
jgi:type IV pilus assembly protein PilM